MRLIIIGAGLAGLGAAHRLDELGEKDWHLYEAAPAPGGLARPVCSAGFTYDLGFRYDLRHPYIAGMFANLVSEDTAPTPVRDAALFHGKLMPAPFQQHIRMLDPQTIVECVMGLAKIRRAPAEAANLREWLRATFGDGIAMHFFEPYFAKHFAHPLELVDHRWTPGRVPEVDLESTLRSIIEDVPAADASTTESRIYPRGGMATALQPIADRVERRLSLDTRVTEVDPERRTVRLANGLEDRYDALISTMPLNELIAITRGCPSRVRSAAQQLSWSNALLVGVGFDRPLTIMADRIHIADPALPFSRIVQLSAMSPGMTPSLECASLVTEASVSNWHDHDRRTLVADTIDALVATGLVSEDDRAHIIDATPFEVVCARPTPTIERDVALELIQPYLLRNDIYARGLAGAWMYEAGDLDVSLMQGVEAVDHILLGAPERSWPAPRTVVQGAAR